MKTLNTKSDEPAEQCSVGQAIKSSHFHWEEQGFESPTEYKFARYSLIGKASDFQSEDAVRDRYFAQWSIR